jgi:hypothetical protein
MSRAEYRAPRVVDPVVFIRAIDAPDRDEMIAWMESFRREVNAAPMDFDVGDVDPMMDLKWLTNAKRVVRRERDGTLVPLVPLEFESLPPQPDLEERARHYCYRVRSSASTPGTASSTVWRDRDPGDEHRERSFYGHVRYGGVVCRYPGQRARVEPCGLADHDPGDESDARTGPIELRPVSYVDGIDDSDDYERIDKT